MRRHAVAYSDAYNTRLTIHRIGSYTMLPLFAGEWFLGDRLLNGVNPPSWVKPTHVGVAGALGVLFTTNTVTGAWNLWDSRDDPAGRTRRYVHTGLMLASDAGFLWASAIAGDAKHNFNAGTTTPERRPRLDRTEHDWHGLDVVLERLSQLMIDIHALARPFESWNAIYSHSKVISTTVTTLHVGAMFIGGGFAIAADRITLRVAARRPDERARQLAEILGYPPSGADRHRCAVHHRRRHDPRRSRELSHVSGVLDKDHVGRAVVGERTVAPTLRVRVARRPIAPEEATSAALLPEGNGCDGSPF